MSVILPEAVAELLAPIPDDSPGAANLRRSGLYHDIRSSRDSDDPGLPLGAWDRALKRADWPRVVQLCRGVLVHYAKDLQVAAWLAEAWVRQDGFAAVAPGLTLVEQLLSTHWDGLFPPLDDEPGDDGPACARAACIEALDKYLVQALRSAPLGEPGRGAALNYGVWQGAVIRDARLQHMPRHARPVDDDQESMSEINARLGEIETQRLVEIGEHLARGLAASGALAAAVDRRFGRQAPDMTKHPRVMMDMRRSIGALLEPRGVRPFPGMSEAAG